MRQNVIIITLLIKQLYIFLSSWNSSCRENHPWGVLQAVATGGFHVSQKVGQLMLGIS